MTKFNLKVVSKPRQTRADKWRQRPCVMKYRAYADELRKQALEQDYTPSNHQHIAFYIAMPKSWSKAKKALHEGDYHTAKPDIDNLLKAFMDALMPEDKALSSISVSKYWSPSEDFILVQESVLRV